MKTAHNTFGASSDEEIKITEKGVRDIIQRLRNKASGPDKIPYYALKSLLNNSISHILNIYNTTLALNHFLTPWKTAKIVPVPKPNKPKAYPSSYRPISLLNTVSKILEMLILKSMLEYINDHNLLYPDKFGFTTGHFAVQKLDRVVDVVSANMQKNISRE